MKRLLIILLTLLLSTGSWANKERIKLNKIKKGYENVRSLSLEPSAYHDGNTLYLYSDVPLNELQVTVKDEAGRILSSEIVPIFPDQPYTFSIGEVENGIYTLELNDGKKEYYGYFEIY